MIERPTQWSTLEVYPSKMDHPSPPLSETIDIAVRSVIGAINRLNNVLNIDAVIGHVDQLTWLEVLQMEYQRCYTLKKIPELKALKELIEVNLSVPETIKVRLEFEIGVRNSSEIREVQHYISHCVSLNRGFEWVSTVKHVDLHDRKNMPPGISYYIFFTCVLSQ